MSIQIRIFIGYAQNKEIKIHLNQSAKWKEAKILASTTLTETCWQEKDYIGLFISSLMNCKEINEKGREVRTQLQLYCPKLDLDKYSTYLLSQPFIF
jgi:hypothetical protein